MEFELNHTVAGKLREIADLLEQQGANRFRVQAYRRAAGTVDALDEDVQALFDREGVDGLERLPGIGRGIARSVYEMLALGRSIRLENLRGELDKASLRSRDAFWDFQVPKTHLIFDSLLLPRPPCVRAASPHLRKLGAGYAALPQMAGRRVRMLALLPLWRYAHDG